MTQPIHLTSLWFPVLEVHLLRSDVQTLVCFGDLPREMEERLEPEMDGPGRFISLLVDNDELAILTDAAGTFAVRVYAEDYA